MQEKYNHGGRRHGFVLIPASKIICGLNKNPCLRASVVMLLPHQQPNYN